MREYKFRAWDEKQKRILTWDWFDNETIDDVFKTNEYGGSGKTRFILMQWTGLLDKNGKEIYIGDILRINNDNYDPADTGLFVGLVKVEATELLGCSFTPITKINKYAFDSHSMWHVGEKDTTEIIGNIYESPELLKEAR